MKRVKDVCFLSMILAIYLGVLTFLLQQFQSYQKIYEELSELLSHPTIELLSDSSESRGR